MAAAKSQNLKDVFLAYLVKGHMPVTVFLTNGVKLSGVISMVDEDCLTLARDGMTQLVMKHAVSTVMPQDAMNVFDVIGE
ncbi:MAG: RNA chaperone Hfq [Alphaproteobacteria bacterium CG_4_10_14_0_8_um_filter_53_9]|nr:MAG: RNA chaperone Hfq [Alphaproteobacteria bacterium CG_4_10_14_0_8_um_filter_53_9]